jgi:hypothetical protein
MINSKIFKIKDGKVEVVQDETWVYR